MCWLMFFSLHDQRGLFSEAHFFLVGNFTFLQHLLADTENYPFTFTCLLPVSREPQVNVDRKLYSSRFENTNLELVHKKQIEKLFLSRKAESELLIDPLYIKHQLALTKVERIKTCKNRNQWYEQIILLLLSTTGL
jgi:hypothetical protein